MSIFSKVFLIESSRDIIKIRNIFFQYLNKNISRKLLVSDCQSYPNTFNHSRMNCKFLLSSRFCFLLKKCLKKLLDRTNSLCNKKQILPQSLQKRIRRFFCKISTECNSKLLKRFQMKDSQLHRIIIFRYFIFDFWHNM